ncbi:D-inositol 3-phosphate glycosyltransferase [Stylophora pistillata]|uniref:D-inositol 3-phosphate glycosyltransferase n=1 Tax=Stylophora pistillata TaxID=50429 RepID=A0A2B4RQW0_STYPI|nr:D-inositol 3-phosphate glycosyltransferase [Stylophora pistillata]
MEFLKSHLLFVLSVNSSLVGKKMRFRAKMANDRKLNVTLLSSEWRSSTDGDLSTINRELAIQLAKHSDVEVTVFLPQCSEEDRRNAASHNVQLLVAERLPGMNPVDCLMFVPDIHLMDFVVGHGVTLGRQAQSITRYRHCIWIQVVHTAPEELGMYKSVLQGKQVLKTEDALCRMADQVVAIGSKLADTYKRYLRSSGKEQNVFDVTPGIFSEFLDVEQVAEERRTFSVLVIGSDHNCEDFILKGYDLAAQAIAELKDKSYQLRLVGAPRAKEDEIADKILQLGIDRNQLIVGSFSGSRKVLANLFLQVDLAIMPSTTDEFGLMALEALFAGLPVLVSGNSGLGEALKEVPLGSQCVIDSEDPKDWAKMIKEVREKKREVRLLESRLLREKYLEKYSWEEPIRRLVERLHNLKLALKDSSGSHSSPWFEEYGLSPTIGSTQVKPVQRRSYTQASKSQEDQDGRILKVTLLSSEWRSSTDGDLSTINRELAIQLAKHPDVEVTVFLPQCSEEDRRNAASHNVQLLVAERLPGMNPVDCLMFVPDIHLMDFVVGHGVTLGRQAQSITRYRHCIWIQVVHTAPEELGMYKSVLQGKQVLKTEDALCRMADQVVAIGSKLADTYKRYLRSSGKEQNVFDVTPGIFSEFLDVEQAIEERRTFSVLIIGSGDSWEDFILKERRTFSVLVIGSDHNCEDFILKGYDLAAQAIAELKDKSYQLRLVGAPRAKEDEIADKILQLGIDRNQLIVGSFSGSRKVLANLFLQVDLAIMPSTTDEFGLMALEALFAGLPVLVSGNSGLGEALKEVPLGSQCVIDSEDPKDWAKMIKEVREKKREVRLLESRLLREKYLEKYSWEEPIRRLVERLHNLKLALKDSSGSHSSPWFEEYGLSPTIGSSQVKRAQISYTQALKDSSGSHSSPWFEEYGLSPTIEEELLEVKEKTMEENIRQDSEASSAMEIPSFGSQAKSLTRMKSLLYTESEECKVDHQGTTWNLTDIQAGGCITFTQDAVSMPLLFGCKLLEPTVDFPPLNKDERLVSSVIELTCDEQPDIHFTGQSKGEVVIALSHSAPKLEGYEVVIRELVSSDSSYEWKDLETTNIWQIPDFKDDFAKLRVPYSEAKVTTCGVFAVIYRLKSYIYSTRVSGNEEITHKIPEYPEVSVTIPAENVRDRSNLELILKRKARDPHHVKQEVPSNEELERLSQQEPSNEELEWLSHKLKRWKTVGRRLGIEEATLTAISKENEEYFEKTYQMLLNWKGRESSAATYQVIHEALCHELVERADLADELYSRKLR